MTQPVHQTPGENDAALGDELPAGAQLCGGQYTIERYLNSGGFGITYLARDSLDRRVVIKECFPGAMCFRQNTTVCLRSSNSAEEFNTILELFEKEARALSDLQHPNIVGVHQIFKDNGTAYMALDFIEGRDLLQVIEEEPDLLGPEDVHRLLLTMLDAVAYIHERDVLHRDISPDNILLDRNNEPILIDFGAARESATRVSRVLSKVLTVKDGYSPQEFYLQGSKQEYSSDLYALAATFYHLVSGDPPPSSHLRLAAAARGAEDPLKPLERKKRGYDDHFLDAINRCLSVFPQDRLPSAHAWRDMIDFERRRQVLLDEAERDLELERRVERVVREYRRALAEETKAKAAPARSGEAEAKGKPVQKRRVKTTKPRRKPPARRRIETIPPAAPNVPPIAGPQPTNGADRTLADAPPRPQSTREAVREDGAPTTGAPSSGAPTTVAASSGEHDTGDRKRPRSLRRLLAGTKHLILGQKKTLHE